MNYDEYMTERQKALYDEKIDRRSRDECWPWYGHVNSQGYGVVWLKPNERHVASRIAWSLHHGRTIPEGYFICHHCDRPECQNPHHLFLGLQLHNMQDASRKGRTCRGSDRPETNLSEDVVHFARLIYHRGLMRVGEIARWFGINHSTCSYMLHGKTWKHVPMPEEVQNEL